MIESLSGLEGRRQFWYTPHGSKTSAHCEGYKEGYGLKATGRHLLVEYHECNREVLNNLNTVETLMCTAAKAAKASVVGSVFHPFVPHGVSGVVVIEESHLSIHTWPEHGYAAVDFFTCGECIPEKAHEVLLKGLDARSAEIMHVKRGMLPGPQSMSVSEHRVEERTEKPQESQCEDTLRGVSSPLGPSTTAMSCMGRR